jgi:hypothetical protein
MLLFALIEQAAVVQRRRVVWIERDRLVELGQRFFGFSGSYQRLAARRGALRVAYAGCGWRAACGVASFSGADDHDPRSKEQPHSVTATNAISAGARRPKREASEGKGAGMAILAKYSRG